MRGFSSRGFTGRRRVPEELADRLPPGQHEASQLPARFGRRRAVRARNQRPASRPHLGEHARNFAVHTAFVDGRVVARRFTHDSLPTCIESDQSVTLSAARHAP